MEVRRPGIWTLLVGVCHVQLTKSHSFEWHRDMSQPSFQFLSHLAFHSSQTNPSVLTLFYLDIPCMMATFMNILMSRFCVHLNCSCRKVRLLRIINKLREQVLPFFKQRTRTNLLHTLRGAGFKTCMTTP